MAIPELIDFKKERIRILHFTWIAFFITYMYGLNGATRNNNAKNVE